MSVGVWEPKKSESLDEQALRELLVAFRDADAEDLTTTLDRTVQTEKVGLMKQEQSAFDAARELNNDELVDLIKFFTLAEMQLPGWEGGVQNPVIYLARILKDRDALDPQLRKWIKAHTDNRYLPHGSAL